jgi:hypothetical protein
VQSVVECWGPGLYLTNYETAREGKLDPIGMFGFVSLDEAAVLRGFGGTKTFRAFMNAGWQACPIVRGHRHALARTSTSSCWPMPPSWA